MSKAQGLAAAVAVVVMGGALLWLLRQERPGDDVPATPARTEAVSSAHELPEFSQAEAAPLPVATTPPGPSAPAAIAPASAEAPGVATLRITVVNEDRAPLPEASVFLKSAPLNVLRTGADGMVSVTAAFGSEVDVAARHPEHRFALLHARMPETGEPPAEATIVLHAELTACLLVTGERGQPLPGAEVSFRELRGDNEQSRSNFVGTPDELAWWMSMDQFRGNFDETRTAGPDGRCCVAGITAGPVVIDARAAGHVTAIRRSYEIGPRGGDIGTLQLTAARRLHGAVVDAQGPVPGALVETILHGRETGGGYLHVVTDAEGRFSFDSISPTARHIPLCVSHPARGDFFDPVFPLPPDDATIALRPAFDLTLLPRDAATRDAVSGPCTVTRLLPSDGLTMRASHPKPLTIEAGSLHVGWLPYFATGVQLEVPGCARTVVDLAAIEAAAGAPVVVDLVRSGTIVIHALDGSTGQPVTGAKVMASRLTPRGIGSNWLVDLHWDEAAVAYVLDTSQFTFERGVDETFLVTAPDHAASERITVSANGVRVCGPVVDVTLQPK